MKDSTSDAAPWPNFNSPTSTPQLERDNPTPTLHRVKFHDDTLLLLVPPQGQPLVVLRPITEALGLDWAEQYQRLMGDTVLSSCAVVIPLQLPGETQRREVLFLPLDLLNGWLFGISTQRVDKSIRDKVHLYQREVYRFLLEHVSRLTGPASPLSRLEILQLAVSAEQERLKLETEKKQLEQSLAVLERTGRQDAPRVERDDPTLRSETLMPMKEAAKIVGIGHFTLFELLRQDGMLMDRRSSGEDNHNIPYPPHLENGRFKIRERQVNLPGSQKSLRITRRTTLVTQKGLDFLIRTYGNKAVDDRLIYPSGVMEVLDAQILVMGPKEYLQLEREVMKALRMYRQLGQRDTLLKLAQAYPMLSEPLHDHLERTWLRL